MAGGIPPQSGFAGKPAWFADLGSASGPGPCALTKLKEVASAAAASRKNRTTRADLIVGKTPVARWRSVMLRALSSSNYFTRASLVNQFSAGAGAGSGCARNCIAIWTGIAIWIVGRFEFRPQTELRYTLTSLRGI